MKLKYSGKKIRGTHKEFNENAKWLKNEEARYNGLEEQEWNEIATAELKNALRKTQKWKSPGIDKVPNFWLNGFESIYNSITNCLNKTMTILELDPKWFTLGITYLPSKSNETNIPENY